MKIIKQLFWIYYVGDVTSLDLAKSGKWMYFFNDKKFASKICKKAIKKQIVVEAKHSNSEEGVVCFYLNSDDIEAHKKIIKFMIDNDLIRKTKSGRLYNISFKMDSQTLNNEYGSEYKSDISLNKFIDLNDCQWII